MKKILSSILILSVLACGQATVKQNTNIEKVAAITVWKVLDNSNYTIEYPALWELKEGGMGLDFLVLSPLEYNEDKFRENVNLLVQDLPSKEIDLTKYAELSESQIRTMLKNATIMESKRIENGGGEYQKLIYRGDQAGFSLQFEQYYTIVNGKAYVLTLTVEQNKVKNFKDVGEKILNSFKLKR